MYLKALLSAAAVVLMVSSPGFAKKPDMPPGQPKKISKSVPGPVAALGLPAGAAIAGYVWLRRRRPNGQKKT